MNTTRRLSAAAVLAVVTLVATACIGVAPGDLPAAGETSTLVFHPRYANTSGFLTLPNDVKGSYTPAVDKGRIRQYVITYRTAPSGTENFVLGVLDDLRTQRNGSISTDVTFPANLCTGPVTVTVAWSQAPNEVVRLPVVKGTRCP